MSKNILVQKVNNLTKIFFLNQEKLKTKLLLEFFIIKKIVLKVSFMKHRDARLL